MAQRVQPRKVWRFHLLRRFNGGTPASYAWSVRDANGRLLSSASQSGSGNVIQAFSFAPPQGGRFVIQLDVTLTDSRSATATYVIENVVGLGPIIDAIA